jgi:predicted RNA-binding protein YlxR (DUF448 family)
VGCRGRAAKAALVRVVRTAGGTARVDPRGTAGGRGAYVHPSAACVDAAERRGAFGRALGSEVGPEEARKLREIVESMQERM